MNLYSSYIHHTDKSAVHLFGNYSYDTKTQKIRKFSNKKYIKINCELYVKELMCMRGFLTLSTLSAGC